MIVVNSDEELTAWKSEGRSSFGLCTICDKWKKTMSIIYKGEYLCLCMRDYYDLFGEKLSERRKRNSKR